MNKIAKALVFAPCIVMHISCSFGFSSGAPKCVPNFQEALNRPVKYGTAAREMLVKPILKDVVDHTMNSTPLFSVGPFKLTSKEAVQSIIECLVNTIHCYLQSGDMYTGACLKASALGEVLYKIVGDIVRSTGWNTYINDDTKKNVEKFGGASLAKLFLVIGFNNAIDRLKL